MPPKPVKPKGIAGTDLPMSALSDGIEAVKTKVKEMYAPGSREYARAMEVLNRISEQRGLQENDKDPEDPDTRHRKDAPKAWDARRQSALGPEWRDDAKGVTTTSLKDLKKMMKKSITKEQLRRIVKEEIKEALEDGYRGTSWPFTAAGQAKKRNKQEKLKYSNAMIAKGEADALAGIPKDENIVHLGYHQAYDKALKQKLNPVQEQ